MLYSQLIIEEGTQTRGLTGVLLLSPFRWLH